MAYTQDESTGDAARGQVKGPKDGTTSRSLRRFFFLASALNSFQVSLRVSLVMRSFVKGLARDA